jgi:cell division inhibitor SulA/protein ImuA
MKPTVAQLLHNPFVWRGDSKARTDKTVPSGYAELDQALPGGGWPQGALTELLRDEEGIGELRLLLPALERLAQADEWIVLVAPPHLPCVPAFAAAGVDPARVIVVGAAEDKHRWWAAEQALRANSAGAVLFWPVAPGEQRLRRLQVAAQEGEALAFLFTTTTRVAHPSPAPLRIRLSPAGGRLRLDVFKRRGGVLGAPLLLDVVTGGRTAADNPPCAPAKNKYGPAPLRRPVSFNRRYPVGGREAQIWNRALARADEVRRVPGPDPRGRSRMPTHREDTESTKVST